MKRRRFWNKPRMIYVLLSEISIVMGLWFIVIMGLKISWVFFMTPGHFDLTGLFLLSLLVTPGWYGIHKLGQYWGCMSSEQYNKFFKKGSKKDD